MKNTHYSAKNKAFRFLLMMVFTLSINYFDVWGQTNPTPQALPYSQDFSSLAHSSTTYPDGWHGWQLATTTSTSFRLTAPTGDRSLFASSTAATTSGNVHNYNGKIGFLNIGSLDLSLTLAINTTGQTNIEVEYDIMTIRNPFDGGTNTRINEVTLQYRVGTSGNFTNLTGIEYQNNTDTQTAGTTPQKSETKTVTLPAACNNQPNVQIRWVSREVSGGGARPSFAIDNISIEGIDIVPCPGLENFNNAALTATYADGSFTGNNDILWTYGQTRDEGDYPINGKGIMLRRASDSYLEATISGGVGNFSFDYRKAFTGNEPRQLEVIVDGITFETTPVFGTISGEETDIYNLTVTISNPDDITIRIKNVGSTTTNRQVVIDNIMWTCYTPCTNTEDFFRTKSSGNWSDNNIWETSEDGIDDWLDATCPPDFNAYTITISNGHTVTINSSIEVDQVIIENGAILSHNSGTLSLKNGTGDDLIIEEGGVLLYSGGSAPIYDHADTRIRVKSGGKIQVNNNTAGLSNAMAGNGSSNRIIFEHNSVFDWNNSLIFANFDQVYFPDVDALSIPIFRISANVGDLGSSNPTTFNGLFECNGSISFISGGVKNFRNGIIGSGDITQTIGCGRFYFTGDTAYLGGTGKIVLTGDRINTFNDIYLKLLSDKIIDGAPANNGQLRVTNGCTFDMGPYALSGTGNIRLNSDIILITQHPDGVDGALGGLTGGIDFISPLAQTLIFEKSGTQNSGSLHLPDSLATIIVRNDNELSLQNDIELTQSLVFNGNSIISTVDKIITLHNTDPGAIENGELTGGYRFIDGRLQWASEEGSTYNFPIGFNGFGAQGFSVTVNIGASESMLLGYLENRTQSLILDYAYCDLEENPASGTQVGNGNSGFDGILDQVSFNLHSPLQWNVTNPGGGISNYDITVSASSSQDIIPVESANGVQIRYLMKNGEPGENTPTGDALPSFASTGFYACPNQYSLAAQTSFSLFTIDGASQTAALLPVELLYLSAKATNSETILVEWATATEINNEGFEIQRSTNGVDFNTIGWQQGFGNYSGKLDYSFTDYEVANNVNYYYRLKQMDFDGQYEYSKIVSVNIHNLASFIEIYPVPANDYVFIKSSADIISVEVFDFAGRKLMSEIGTKEINLSSLTSGAYLLLVNTTSGTETLKLMKN
jgi:hypothetical protein